MDVVTLAVHLFSLCTTSGGVPYLHSHCAGVHCTATDNKGARMYFQELKHVLGSLREWRWLHKDRAVVFCVDTPRAGVARLDGLRSVTQLWSSRDGRG